MKKVDLTKRTKVFATGTGNYLKEGKELNVHPILAKKLIDRGLATDKPKK